MLPGGSPDGSSDEGARPAPDAGAVDPGAVGSPLPASELEPLVAAQTQRSAAELPPMRLADGLTPPTNRWFSGLVFGDEPQPVFPLPLAVGIDDRSFGFGLPQVVTSADSIVGSHQRDVSVTIEDSRRQQVSAYDDLSVTVRGDRRGRHDAGPDHDRRGVAVRHARRGPGRRAGHLGEVRGDRHRQVRGHAGR